MSATAIEDVRAWQALDSRGTPTVACEVRLSGGASAEVVVPSGASTGRYEAVERRDGGPAFDGRGVRAAVANVVTELRVVALGRDGCDQSGLDAALRAADGTPALDRLGGNAVLAVSLATWLATARQCDLPAWRLLARSAGTVPSLPLPMVKDSGLILKDRTTFPAAITRTRMLGTFDRKAIMVSSPVPQPARNVVPSSTRTSSERRSS